MRTSARIKPIQMVALVLLLTLAPLFALTLRAEIIDDRNGALIYWGGKYVNIKPSHYTDAIGTRSRLDQMEVLMKDDMMTVTITGPYFFNYVHNAKATREIPPGDLYISSKGWKVSGSPPYNLDIFEESEGWDRVVSFTNKAVYKLKFSSIKMTNASKPGSQFRTHQAWRGGYGERLDDAAVDLSDKGLTFTFSVRNMTLGSEIGLHWTMKCGNDIIEGKATILLPLAAEAPAVDAVTGELVEEAPAEATSAAATAAPAVDAFGGAPALAGGQGALSGFFIPIVPWWTSGSGGGGEGGGGGGILPVPEPSVVLLLIPGLLAVVIRSRLARG